MKEINQNIYGLTKLTSIVLLILFNLMMPKGTTQANQANQEILITADFSDREVAPDERIELRLSRDLEPGEGRFALFIGITDLTSLFLIEPNSLNYTPKFIPLPVGENILTVYVVNSSSEWKTLAKFPLKVKAAVADETKPEETENIAANNDSTGAETTGETNAAGTNPNEDKFKTRFTPNVSLNIKNQNQILTFPRDAAPERNPFTDLAGQGEINLK